MLNHKVIFQSTVNEFDSKSSVVVTVHDADLWNKIATAVEKCVRDIIEREDIRASAAKSNREIAKSGAYRNPTGRPCDEIVVLGIDPEILAPAGVTIGEVYDSTGTLSKLLGYEDYNRCSQALSNAKRFGKDQAKVRGVSFCYAKDTMDVGE